MVGALLLSSFHLALKLPVFVRTPSLGLVQGLRSETASGSVVDSFRGMYYSLPPTGAHRWQSPRSFERRGGDSGTHAYDATAKGPWCYQTGSEVSYTANDTISEDCLHLNLFRAAPGKLAENGTASPRTAVLVHVHGGGFVDGGNSDLLYDGSHLALASRGGAMVVSVNYRLGPRTR